MNMRVRTTSNLRHGRPGLAAVLLLAAAGCSRANVQAAAPAMPAPLVTVFQAELRPGGRRPVALLADLGEAVRVARIRVVSSLRSMRYPMVKKLLKPF